MASKNAGNSLAGKVAIRSIAVNGQTSLDTAAPLIAAALADTAPATLGQGVIASSFNPATGLGV